MSTVNPDASLQLEAIDKLPLSTLLSTDVQARIPESLRETPFRVSFIYAVQAQKKIQASMKRAFDFLFAFLGLCVLAVPLAIIALAIKIDSRGPILFKQKRVGLNGQTFYMYKFRSMFSDAEDRLAALLEHNEIKSGMFKMKNDPQGDERGAFPSEIQPGRVSPAPERAEG